MNGVTIISVGPYPPVSDKETQTKEQLLLSTKRAVGPQDVCLRIEDRTHSQQLRTALGCHEGDTYRQVELMQSLKYYEKDSKVCVCEGGGESQKCNLFPLYTISSGSGADVCAKNFPRNAFASSSTSSSI